MSGAYYRSGAFRSAVAHPYHVMAFASWTEYEPTVTVGFQTEDEARSFAASRPEPIIDLVRRDHGCIAQRRAIANPHAPLAFVHRDDFVRQGAPTGVLNVPARADDPTTYETEAPTMGGTRDLTGGVAESDEPALHGDHYAGGKPETCPDCQAMGSCRVCGTPLYLDASRSIGLCDDHREPDGSPSCLDCRGKHSDYRSDFGHLDMDPQTGATILVRHS